MGSVRLKPIFDTNIFGHVQDGSISAREWRFLLRNRPGHGWPISVVTALELLAGLPGATPEKFQKLKGQIEFAHKLSKGRVLRQAWIPGSWDILAGQFFQNWDPDVKSFGQCVFESWQPRWISIDWGFEHSTVVLWWTRVRIKTDLDQKAERTALLCYRQLVVLQMNEQLVAERIATATSSAWPRVFARQELGWNVPNL